MDMQAVRQRLQKLKSGGGNPHMWRPDEGQNIIRIVPYRFKTGDMPLGPFMELYLHYDLDGPNYLSPISFEEGKGFGTQELIDRKDPIAEFAEYQRRNNGDPGWEIYKTLYPTLRIHAPVVVRGEEDKGVRYWGFSKTVYEDLLAYIADPDWGDITDPQEGRDIKVMYDTESGQYAQTDVSPKPVVSPLAKNKEEASDLLKDHVPIEEAFDDIPTEEELEQALESWLKSQEEGEEEGEVEEPSPTASQAGTNADDFDEEYDNLFND